jgi:DinB superfamily
MNPTPMNSTLHQLQREIAASLHSLDATKTQFRPPSSPRKWSIQQIIEHLLLTYSSTETAINARLSKRTPTRARPTLTQRVFQIAVTRCGYFPTGRDAPEIVTPQPTTHPLSGEDLAHATAEHLARLDLLFTEAETLFGPASQCATHAVLGPLNIDQWRKFQLIHGEHHLKQIAAIRKAHRV